MGIRKTTQRDERRRRVLVDERILTPIRQETANASMPRPSGRIRRYAEAALINRQPRICSFVPIRPWTVTIWFLVGLSFVVAHATAFALMVRYGPAEMPIDLAPIHLSGPGALSNWSASLMLMLAAVLSALIVQFRRHRIDDYRGEYRVWYYVLAGMVLASIDASIGGHQILLESVGHAAARYEIPHASLWINGLLSICVTGVSVRLLMEVRSSRGTVVTGILAGLAYLCHMLLTTGIWPVPSSDLHDLSVGLARLNGHYLLLMSLVVYSRYVVLDAQGLIQHAAKTKKKATGKARKATSSDQTATPSSSKVTMTRTTRNSNSRPSEPASTPDSAPSEGMGSQPKPTQSRPAVQESSRNESDVDISEEDEGPATLKMSKSERRKVRKQKRRDRRAA